jgi:hypothetical protein
VPADLVLNARVTLPKLLTTFRVFGQSSRAARSSTRRGGAARSIRQPCLSERLRPGRHPQHDHRPVRARRANNGLDHLDIDSFLKVLIRGLILLMALIINVYAQRLRSARQTVSA